MQPRIPLRAAALCAVSVLLSCSAASAQVECWAPGMTSPVTLSENTRSRAVSFTRPYRYDVFGVAGRLVLGNRAVNTQVVDNEFRLKLLGLIGFGSAVDSTAYVRLQTGLTQYYPTDLSVKGRFPGVQAGPVHQYGQSWTLCDPRNPRDVNLTFHLAGSGLLGGILAPAYYNLNPTGYFYVLGEYHSAPPVMTGEISIASNTVLYGASVPISYRIDRVEQRPVYRPPFLGLDLGDANLTIGSQLTRSRSRRSAAKFHFPKVIARPSPRRATSSLPRCVATRSQSFPSPHPSPSHENPPSSYSHCCHCTARFRQGFRPPDPADRRPARRL